MDARRGTIGQWWLLLGLAGGLAACGNLSLQGGTETGNPDTTATRTVTGSVTESADTTASLAVEKHGAPTWQTAGAVTADGCLADAVDAINSKKQVVSTEVDADCAFELALPVRKAYLFRFRLEGETVGFLTINHNNSAYSTFIGVVSQDTAPLHLGRVTFTQRVGRAQQEFAQLNDRDGDGVTDYDDTDDDNDGVEDDDEDDCDLDGIVDEDDEENDNGECEAESPQEQARVWRVNPRNATLFELVDRDLPVDAQMTCELDPDTVDATTFRVVSAAGVAIDCQYQFPNSDNGVRCRHDNDRFEALTIYTATIDGVQCRDGRSVQRRSWSWRAANE